MLSSPALSEDGKTVSTCPAQRAERPRDPGGVAAFMSAHSKTPCITPSMELPSGKGVVRGRGVQQLAFAMKGGGNGNGNGNGRGTRAAALY